MTSDEFEALRPYLRRVAYGVLGSLTEAEDVVQDAWIRLEAVDREEIDDLRAWLTTVVARRALDVLGSARVRREAYVGPWLPEPVVEELGPEERVTLDESVSLALLVVLEKLSPAERTAFILHDVFGYAFSEVAETVGRSDAAVRQLAARARRHVEEEGARFTPSAAEHERVFTAFAMAIGGGGLDELVAVLDPSVVFHADGGGKVKTARKPMAGADRVARALIALRNHKPEQQSTRVVRINGRPGLLTVSEGVTSVMSVTVRDGRVVRVDVIRNPEKLGAYAQTA